MTEVVHINKDCRFYKGSAPCFWNKTKGYECASCGKYSRRGERILIVKLDAIIDVLRDRSRLRNMGENSRKAAIQLYSGERVSRLMLKAYEDILTGRRSQQLQWKQS